MIPTVYSGTAANVTAIDMRLVTDKRPAACMTKIVAITIASKRAMGSNMLLFAPQNLTSLLSPAIALSYSASSILTHKYTSLSRTRYPP